MQHPRKLKELIRELHLVLENILGITFKIHNIAQSLGPDKSCISSVSCMYVYYMWDTWMLYPDGETVNALKQI